MTFAIAPPYWGYVPGGRDESTGVALPVCILDGPVPKPALTNNQHVVIANFNS